VLTRLLLALVLVATPAAASAGAAEPRSVVPGPAIAFTQGRALLVMRPDGTGVRTVIAGRRLEASTPVWSPDGRRIAFVRSDVNEGGIYVVGRDGSGLRRVGSGTEPSWSPDGSRIAFGAGAGSTSAIFTMRLDGSDRRQLTRPRLVFDGTPDWSPDGRRIAFVRDNDRVGTIHVMKADGSNRFRLAAGIQPRWSPDSRSLAFVSGKAGGISVMDSDGGRQRRVNTTPRSLRLLAPYDGYPTWSADGRRLAFVRFVDEPKLSGIYAIGVDGRNRQALATARNVSGLDWWAPPTP
jgi:TolB protein